jgi:hypothetical protein
MDMDTRVNLSLALHRYNRAVERFEEASKEFNESCQAVRAVTKGPARLVVHLDHKTYLFECDGDGSFVLYEVESI